MSPCISGKSSVGLTAVYIGRGRAAEEDAGHQHVEGGFVAVDGGQEGRVEGVAEGRPKPQQFKNEHGFSKLVLRA